MSTETPPSPTPIPPSVAQPIYMMYPPDPEDSIDLIELVAGLWQRKSLIAGVTFLFAVAGVAYALLATPIYRAEVVLAPSEQKQGPSIPADLGGLAGLVGINLGSSADQMQAVPILRSRVFIEEFVSEKDLLPVLFADKWDVANERWLADDPEDWPDIRDGVKFFTEEIRSVTEDTITGLITLGIEWIDPELAADWVDELVDRINERLRTRDLANSERRLEYLNGQLEKASLVELRQAISRLIENEIQTIMLAQAEMEYAFKVIDPARVPNERIAPRRTVIVILATLLGGMIGVFVAWLLWAATNRRATASQ